jgi:hypothetical protein
MKRHLLLSIITLLSSFLSFAQNRNSNWCFGDSAGINFNGTNTTLFTAALKTRGSAISVSDSIGQLLFYAYTRATISGNTTRVINSNHVLMQNGGSIVGEGWYQELCAVPSPGNPNLYYLFSVGEAGSSQLGLFYSVIDMSQNSGLGAVILKNVQLQSYYADDCVKAIKHGNGRDWWVISREWQTVNDSFYEYLISPSGVGSVNTLHVGTAVNSGFYHFTFSKSGSKMAAVTTQGLIELFDFDRCTGLITYRQTIQVPASPIRDFFSCEFSPSERYLYVSALGNTHPTYLIQFDLSAANILLSADTLWTYTATPQAGGFLKLAPNNKIYFACAWYDGMNFNYPYPDTAFYTVNNNLSVINYPDSPGAACDFQPFSFNLGLTARCYWGLPNNPDYEMGAMAPCDSLTTIDDGQLTIDNGKLFVFYHSGWQIAFINAKDLKGKSYSLSVFDLMGKEVYREEGKADRYFTKDLNCAEFANGIYIVSLQTEREKLVERFVKE